MILLNSTRPALDPRIVGFTVILLGTTAMFMNKAMTAHIVCAVAAACLLAAKAYRPASIYLTVYVVVALLMANVDSIHNTSAMLLVVSLSYFVQKLVVLLMLGGFFVRMTSIPYALSAMQYMKVPDAAAVPVMVALRFFPTIREDYHCLKDSLRIRRVSLSPLQFVIHPVRMVEYLFVPILMKSVRTSDELAASALSRGFEHMNGQTILYPLRLRARDFIAALLSVLAAFVLFYMQFN